MMNKPAEVVQFYLKRIEEASHPVERQIIKSDLQLYYYRLTADEAKSVEALISPLFEEIEIEMIQKDPLLKRAHDMLSIVKARRSVQV